jgi:hypothetical protein
MHSEEIFELGGKLALQKNNLGGYQLQNQTKLKFQGVGLIKKEPSGNLQTAWIRTLEPGSTKAVDWIRQSGTGPDGRLWAEFREANPLTSSNSKPGEVNLRPLLNFAEKSDDLRPGEVKMVAWTDENLPGLTISPSAAQSRRAVAVVAHLVAGEEPAPQPDENIPQSPQQVPGAEKFE